MNLNNDGVTMKPIGFFYTESKDIPRHWSLSDMEGFIEIDKTFEKGLKNIEPGQRIIVLFHFDRSRSFESKFLEQTPPHRDEPMGLFSICSPIRPNPIGLSILKVIKIKENIIHVRHADMLDKTPILDIKPHIESRIECPSIR